MEEESLEGEILNIQLTPAAKEEIKKLKKMAGVDTQEIIHYCFNVGRIVMEMQQEACQLVCIPNSEMERLPNGKYQTIRHYKAILGRDSG